MMLFADEHGAARLAEIGRDLVQAVEEVRADLAPALAAILAAVKSGVLLKGKLLGRPRHEADRLHAVGREGRSR